MNKQSAINLIRETFENPFVREKYVGFVKNLFNKISPESFEYYGQYIPDTFKQYISKYERVGKYESEDKRIDVLIVYLNRETSIERARTMQRNFVAGYLTGKYGSDTMKDAAVVAFVSPGLDDWRFSLVKMEYKLTQTKTGRPKGEEEFTPARRYSFLVGKNEPNHTAQQQLLPVLQDDINNPTLEQLEKAFSVEKVAKEFLNKYRDLYIHLKESIDRIAQKDKIVKEEFDKKKVNTVDFSKKLLGQIVFLYFLQKKGWLGVPKDKNWGDGDRNFLRSLFTECIREKKNFFNDYLEVLFYNTLNDPRQNQADTTYSKYFNCRIPFLNGGLFEPINNYDWKQTDIVIPDVLFSNNEKTKEGDIGNGILDIFDRFNFTVREDEPLEKEVALDPELLGKVFENLIEENLRKGQGAYYTPREIVHYMCQESLINYLSTELEGKAKKENIELLIKHGEHLIENEKTALQKEENIKSGKQETMKIKSIIPEDIKNNAEPIDEKLANIRVCDPAVGSGAFPVGMMLEIVKARNVLTNYLSKNKERTIYNFKRHCIENCLYGVDIDSSAIDIAKLRFWLSLVVDEEDVTQIKPLPNLDYKIMQGNSLIEKLSVSFLEHDYKRDQLVKSLKKLKDELFNTTSITEKAEKRKQIDGLILKLFEYDKRKEIMGIKHRIDFIKSQGKLFEDKNLLKIEKKEIKELETKIEELKNLKIPGQTEHFEWHINFSEVFREKKGFDVVIANPPYLKERDNKSVFEIINNSDFGKKYHQGKMDYWYYFLHKAIDISKTDSIISYITSRYWLNSMGAKKLIQRVKTELSFTNFIDIGKLKVFDEVAGHHMVAVYAKNKNSDKFIYKKLENDINNIDKGSDTENLKIKYLSNKKIFSDYNEINLDRDDIKIKETISLSEITDISQGVVQNPDKVSKKASKKYGLEKGKGVFVLTSTEYSSLRGLTIEEKKFVRNFYDEKDIGKYYFKNVNRKFLFYLTKANCFTIERYTNIKKHLIKYKEIMNDRRETKKGTIKWFQLHWPRKEKYFENDKIVLPVMFKNLSATFIDESSYFGLSTNIIITKNPNYTLKYILAILNSRFALYWFYKHGKIRGVGVDIGVEKLRTFPIKKASRIEQQPFIFLVDEILSITKDEDYLDNPNKQAKVKEYEHQIDQMVYKLYELTEEEIKIVEGEANK